MVIVISSMMSGDPPPEDRSQGGNQASADNDNKKNSVDPVTKTPTNVSVSQTPADTRVMLAIDWPLADRSGAELKINNSSEFRIKSWPATSRIELKLGTGWHQIVLTRPGFGAINRSVELRAGADQTFPKLTWVANTPVVPIVESSTTPPDKVATSSGPKNPSTTPPPDSITPAKTVTNDESTKPKVESASELAALPDEEAVEAAEKEVAAALGDRYKLVKRPKDKADFSKSLLKLSKDEADSSAVKFVLLRDARKFASESGEVTTALQATDEIIANWKTDAIMERRETIDELARRIRVRERVKPFVNIILADVAVAVDKEDFDAVKGLLSSASAILRKYKDLELSIHVLAVRKSVEKSQVRWEIARIAKAKLEKDPKDAASLYQIAAYQCLNRREWDQGLTQLKKIEDAKLTDLIERDLALPFTVDDQVKLADDWRKWVKSHNSRSAEYRRLEFLKACAQYWYEQAKLQASGIVLSKVRGRLSEYEKLRFKREAAGTVAAFEPGTIKTAKAKPFFQTGKPRNLAGQLQHDAKFTEWLKQQGGNCSKSGYFRGKRIVESDPEIKMINSISMTNANYPANDLSKLAGLPFLQSFNLDSSEFDGSGLAYLNASTDLKRFVLFNNANLSVEGCRQFGRFQKLDLICLEHCDIKPESLAAMLKWTNLKTLSFRKSKITIDHLRIALTEPELGTLDLALTNISDDMLAFVAQYRQVWNLNLNECTKITDASLKSLATMPGLRHLQVSTQQITDVGLANIAKSRTLEYLRVDNTSVTDLGVRSLAGNTRLRSLGLGGTKITGASLKVIGGSMSGLQVLYMDNTKIEDNDLRFIAALPRLSHVSLRGTSVTKEGVAKLKMALPKCYVSGP